MIAAVLQPSYIPWRGYFHQIERADVFVFYDDVQYDKHGWRNRNRIKTANGPTWLTIPVAKKGNVDGGLLIKDAQIVSERPWNRSHLDTIRQAYAKAPHLSDYMPLLEKHLADPPANLCDLIVPLTIDLARELGLDTKFLRSSEMCAKGGQTERLVEIAREVGADRYLSGPAARDYLDEGLFDRAGISVEYMAYDYPEYEQLHPPYDPQVSVIDLLFTAGEDAPGLIWP